jgi:hypothetical protein
MAGLVPAIHAVTLQETANVTGTTPLTFNLSQFPGVDGRDKPGHDGGK